MTTANGTPHAPLPAGLTAPFGDEPGVWLRCALHTHTIESDGWLTPPILRRYHAVAGYDVLAITDHDRYTPAPEGDDNLLLLGGTELSLKAPASGGPLHLLGLGVDDLAGDDTGADANGGGTSDPRCGRSRVRCSPGLVGTAHRGAREHSKASPASRSTMPAARSRRAAATPTPTGTSGLPRDTSSPVSPPTTSTPPVSSRSSAGRWSMRAKRAARRSSTRSPAAASMRHPAHASLRWRATASA